MTISTSDDTEWTQAVARELGAIEFESSAPQLATPTKSAVEVQEELPRTDFDRGGDLPLALVRLGAGGEEFTRPRLQIGMLPYRELEPVPAVTPVNVGEFVLWPEQGRAAVDELMRRDAGGPDPVPIRRSPSPPARPSAPPVPAPVPPPAPRPLPPAPVPLRRAFFALARPRLRECSVTILTGTHDDTRKILGGTVVLTLGVYAVEDAASLEAHRAAWTAGLEQAGYGRATWKFLPVSLRNLQASLDLPATQVVQPPQSTISADQGNVTVLIQLTELGAQLWQDALQQRRAYSLVGVCHLTAAYYTQSAGRAAAQQQRLDVGLGELLSGCGPEVLHTVNLQESMQAAVVVAGYEPVDSLTVAWRPSEGHAPESLMYTSQGGQFSGVITSQHLEAVTIDWSVQILYKAVGWPKLQHGGRLPDQSGAWTLMVKPDAFLGQHVLYVQLVGADGKPLPQGSASPAIQVTGQLSYQAPYLGPTPLVTPFSAGNQSLVKMYYPNYPQAAEAPGQASLAIFTSAPGGAGDAKTRVLRADDSPVIVQVKPDASIRIITVNDAVGELTQEAETMAVLTQLQ